MARRSSGFIRGHRAPRRKTSWEQGPGKVAAQTDFTASNSILVDTASVPTIAELTVARLRGRLQAFLATASGAGDAYSGAFGIGVVASSAFTAGAGSTPTPIDEIGWEGWLYWTAVQLVAADVIDGTASTDGSSMGALMGGINIDVDSKAMRKVDADQTIYGVLQLTEVGTATVKWRFNSRMLVMLP